MQWYSPVHFSTSSIVQCSTVKYSEAQYMIIVVMIIMRTRIKTMLILIVATTALI